MILDNETYEDFLKNFYNKEEFKEDFILRVRKMDDVDTNDYPKDDRGTNDYPNIAYYNGIKVFTIDEYKIEGEKEAKVKLTFPTNVYKCNSKDLKALDTLFEEDCSIRRKGKMYCDNLKRICAKMGRLFDFKMKKISFTLNKNVSLDDIKDLVDEFYAKSVTYGNKYKFDGCFKLSNKMNSKNETVVTFEYNEYIIKSHVIIDLQYWFYKIFKFPYLYKRNVEPCEKSIIKNISFDYTAEYKNEKFKHEYRSYRRKVKKGYEESKTEDEFKLQNFVNNVKAACHNYTGKTGLEKRYQHQFMLQTTKNNDLFQIAEGECVEHFEQEYGIKNKRKTKSGNCKSGRIDCVFYKLKNKKIITDIYLIELKVNKDVVLGDNGVITHLDDIREFLNCEEPKFSFKTLVGRIKNRMEILGIVEDKNEVISDNIRVHFYTIIGFTKDEDRIDVERQIKGLSDPSQISIWCKVNNSKNNTKERLDKYFKNDTLLSVAPSAKQCDVRFYFEEKNWDEKCIGSSFIDKTDEFCSELKNK